MKKLFISQDLEMPAEQISNLSDFCLFCINELPITDNVQIYVISSRERHNIPTTAAYWPGQGIVKVLGKGRALVDVLRSIAHELTHMHQDERGSLVGNIQDAGGTIEDEANARAGEIIKRYAKSSLDRKRIYESAVKTNLKLL